jgi:hypothetical protein
MREVKELFQTQIVRASLTRINIALKHAKRSRNRASIGKVDFSLTELIWFGGNGYNLGLRGIVEWSPSQALRILTACAGFLELYPKEMDSNNLADVSYRRLLCYYLCASLCIQIARLESHIEAQLQHYLMARTFFKSFQEALEELTIRGERSQEEMNDIQGKRATLIAYDFEAAAKLKNWDSLDQMIDEALSMDNQSGKVLECMCDITLCSEAPARIKMLVLQKVVDHMISDQKSEIVKLARWIRCMVQFSIVWDRTVAESLLLQAIELARHTKREAPYPEEEIQWLIGTQSLCLMAPLFDCYCSHCMEQVHRFQLVSFLQRRFSKWRCSCLHSAFDAANGQRFSSLALSLAGLLRDPALLKHLQGKLLEV